MNSQIRIATKEDAPLFIEIKNRLPIKRTDGSTTTGGFLLGTDLKTYEHYIENSFCLVAEADSNIVGFGIVFTDEMLRKSDVWMRREQASWDINLKEYEEKKICYFEQLAFLQGHRKLVIRLAYQLVKWVFDQHYDALFTTTVNKPVVNLAAVPFIKIVSGVKAGNIDEIYPLIGEINSDIYVIESENFYTKTKEHALYPYIKRHSIPLP